MSLLQQLELTLYLARLVGAGIRSLRLGEIPGGAELPRHESADPHFLPPFLDHGLLISLNKLDLSSPLEALFGRDILITFT
jgi:hypothetical protein